MKALKRFTDKTIKAYFDLSTNQKRVVKATAILTGGLVAYKIGAAFAVTKTIGTVATTTGTKMLTVKATTAGGTVLGTVLGATTLVGTAALTTHAITEAKKTEFFNKL